MVERQGHAALLVGSAGGNGGLERPHRPLLLMSGYAVLLLHK
jgi:hypothetical protein